MKLAVMETILKAIEEWVLKAANEWATLHAKNVSLRGSQARHKVEIIAEYYALPDMMAYCLAYSLEMVRQVIEVQKAAAQAYAAFARVEMSSSPVEATSLAGDIPVAPSRVDEDVLSSSPNDALPRAEEASLAEGVPPLPPPVKEIPPLAQTSLHSE
ncbi:hypothetical protein NE237_014550 [Protea cynaroides]|uniref:Uncharacterized protein n=1 Tax=Protea cynaroides TaxID=273540 RepID=A0A9Q0KCD4_9MAGN|nr:hypothetical protein NE237_014550 [Protea cynaroides]